MTSRLDPRLATAAFGLNAAATDAWTRWSRQVGLDAADERAFDLLPRVYRNLSAAGTTVPDLPRLKGLYRRSLAANIAKLTAHAKTLRLIGQHAPRVILLGSAGAAAGIPNGLGTIAMGSIECLIPEQSVEAAGHELERAGWQAHASLQSWNLPHLLRYRHRLALTQPEEKRALALTWRLRPHTSAEALLSSSVPVRQAGLDLYVLCPEHQIVDLAWPRAEVSPWIRTLSALAVICEHAIDWDRLLAGAREQRFEVALLGLLREAHALAPARVPRSAVDAAARAPRPLWQRAESLRPAPSSRIIDRLSEAFFAYQRSVPPGMTVSERWIGLARYLRNRWRYKSL